LWLDECEVSQPFVFIAFLLLPPSHSSSLLAIGRQQQISVKN
jgi:hypothetical protein